MARPRTGSIVRRGNKWYIYYWIGSKRICEPTNALSKSEARRIMMQKMLSGRIDSKVLFKDFAAKWLQHKKLRVKEATFDSYRQIIENHFLPFFGESKLADVKPIDINNFVAILAEKRGKNGKLSTKTVNNIITILHSVFEDALLNDYVSRNPVVLRKHRLPVNQKEKDFFTLEEADRFLRCVDPEYYPFFLVLWHTGLRVGEAIGLQWQDIDFKEGTLSIKRSIYQKYNNTNIVGLPKSRAGMRTIYITKTLLNTLMELKQKQKILDHSGYIFLKDGKLYRKAGLINYQFKKAIKKAGLRETLSPHSLRHGFISLLRCYFPDHLVKAYVGHSLNSDVTSIYTHTTQEQLKEMAKKLDEIFSNKSLNRGIL